MSTGEVIVDGQNVCTIENLNISLMAIEDKIIVMFDEYKSGYECKDCKGTGKVQTVCVCENSGHPGFKNRFKQVACDFCGGDYEKGRRELICLVCKGFGNIIEIPQTAKTLPTTGIVVSMGPETPAMIATRNLIENKKLLKSYSGTAQYDIQKAIVDDNLEHLKNIPVRLGARVIFGPHVGTLIPFKGNIKLKIMRVHEPLAVLFGSEAGAKDFIDFESSNY